MEQILYKEQNGGSVHKTYISRGCYIKCDVVSGELPVLDCVVLGSIPEDRTVLRLKAQFQLLDREMEENSFWSGWMGRYWFFVSYSIHMEREF